MPSLPSADAAIAPHVAVRGYKLASYQHPGHFSATPQSGQQGEVGSNRLTAELALDSLTTSQRLSSEETGNVLLRFTLPKAIGKRKRGSDAPFGSLIDDDRRVESDACLKRSLADNPDSFKVTAIGQLLTQHTFSGLPDFRFDASGSKLARSFGRKLLSQNFKRFSSFKLESALGAQQEAGMLPPPVLSNDDLPFPWAFRSNPYLEATGDAQNNRPTALKSRPYDTDFHFVKYDVKEVPQGPKSEWTPESDLKPGLQDLINRMRSLLRKQNVVTRRLLNNELTPERDIDLRIAIDYCGYRFSSGPWRDAIVKYGYDPRTMDANRHYQTISFQKEKWETNNTSTKNQAKLNHFDGKNSPVTPRTYQVHEITDKLLRSILDSEPPRRECAMLTSGWFNAVVWAKVRIIMRDKIAILASGGQPDDRDYAPIAKMPNILESLVQSKADRESLSGVLSPKQMKLMQEVRIEARKPALLQAAPDQDVEEVKDEVVDAPLYVPPDGTVY